uniref:Uncharacterized protein n=2 Tax=Globodera TaxID=31242 RepID=A0A914I8E9_GLORO
MSASCAASTPANPLKPMARNSSLGENVPPNGGASTGSSAEIHLAPPQVTPDSPRPQKNDQSPLAAVSLTIPLPTNQQKQKPK